jgi:DNA-binding MarR family transcriptional regulator
MPPRPHDTNPSHASTPLCGQDRDLAGQFIRLAELVATASRTLRVGVGQSAFAAGVTEPEVPVLRWCCAAQGGIAQKRLGELLAVSSAHLSEMLESLQRRGLVDARRLASDRRRQVWQASPAGRDAMETLLATLSIILRNHSHHLDAEMVARLLVLLEQVVATLQASPALPNAWTQGEAA